MAINPLGTLKKIREIIKKYNDRQLVKLILALQTELFELQSDNLNLDAKLASLQRQLDAREKMHMRPPFNYYFRDGDDVPFCPKCWKSYGKAIHLPAPEQSSAGIRRDCKICKEIYWEKAVDPRRRQARQRRLRPVCPSDNPFGADLSGSQ